MTVAPPKDPDDFELVDLEQLKNWGRFVLHAVRRRKLLALAIALLAVGATLALLSVMPRTYRIEAQLLAQRNSVMPALGNPSRRIPFEADSPTRGAAEAVLRRNNLLSLMKQTDLLNHWYQNRSWSFRLKDRLVDLIAAPTEEEKTAAMVEFLESRLTVKVVEPTVTISLDWPDARLGYRLVDTALQNFLEQRHSAEVSTIAETITILEGHAANLKEAIDAELEDIKHPPQATPTAAASAASPLPRRDPEAETNKAGLAEVKVLLEAKRRAINELVEFRHRRLVDLQTQLSQQRAIYADAHPAIVTLLQSISALEEPSPQLLALRNEEHELQAEYERLSARRTEGASAMARARSTQASPPRTGGRRADDPDAEYARTRLRFDMEKYDILLERTESARIELDTARAAFKYRYGIIRPPTFPRRPEKPKVPLVLAAGLIAALVLGTLAAAVADIWSGRILELWQINRGLGLPILGEIPRPGS